MTWKSLGKLGAVLALAAGCARERRQKDDMFAGSESCRECHAQFYELWATSHHGLAMQPADETFSRRALAPLTNAITIGASRYRTDAAVRAVIEEQPDGTRTSYPIMHAMGGKNIYYLLTPMQRGRLQVLPVAYDVRSNGWFDAAGSMLRHFNDGTVDEALHWRDPQLTFNTACFGCHVSQIAKNYDAATDTYRTVWREPGISCESCHGPGGEHIRVCRAAPTNQPPADLKLISMRNMTRVQSDETCATCHAKLRPLTDTFTPRDRFFDHYDLIAFESPDFYPDGRDLGENYTYTLWLTSPCVKAGKLDCTHCHTSSGRYRFAGERTNESCLPCHQSRVENATAHTRHPTGSAGNQCVSCHMPMTTFARMRRSDHSMRPPAPAATLAYGSPNACNLCHTDKDAHWADTRVRAWRSRDYQAPVLRRADLIDAARKRNWSRLDDLLAVIADPASDPILAVSLLRLLAPCADPRKGPAIRQALTHTHPLLRSSAAALLADDVSQQNFSVLVTAAKDDYRVVRLAAATALARYPQGLLDLPSARAACEAAFRELEASHRCMPDSWASHYNLGNYFEARGQTDQALASYAHATRLRPDMVPPLVNASMMQARRGDLHASIALLRKAEAADPRNPAVHLNLGMALAEQNDMSGAERHFRAALAADPSLAQAAYNLGVLLNRAAPTAEGIALCRRAAELVPQHAGYVYTHAYYLMMRGNVNEAAKTLQTAIQRGVTSPEITSLAERLSSQLPEQGNDPGR